MQQIIFPILIFTALFNFSNAYCNFLDDILNRCLFQKYLVDIKLTEFSSGIESIDCIYVVNLDEKIFRWNDLKISSEKRGLALNRVSAVNGWKLSPEVIQSITSPNRKMKAGAVGCFLSHISVLKNAYENGFNTIWVLEDDVEIVDDPQKILFILESLYQIDPQWDILYTDVKTLGLINGEEIIITPQNTNILNNHLMRAGNRYGMHSFLISKNGIEKLLKYFLTHLLMAPIDIELHWIPNINKYSVRKNIISNISGFDSTTEFPP